LIIYKTTNLINGKIYIGKYEGKYNYYIGSGKIIKRAIEKYGKENFKRETLEDNIEDHKLLCEREIYWINFYNSTDPKIGYNISHGGMGGQLGIPWSDEQKKKLSLKNSGEKNGNYNKKHSIEIKELISSSGQGRPTRERKYSKYMGVTRVKNRWISSIVKNKKEIYLGSFFTEIQAALAYNKKAIELYGEDARINILSIEEMSLSEIEENEKIELYTIKKTSNFNGVGYQKNIKRWRSFYTINHKYIHIGTFKTEIEAAMGYNEYINENFGWKEKNKLNNIKDEDYMMLWEINNEE
jgi:group I intron endonuclease